MRQTQKPFEDLITSTALKTNFPLNHLLVHATRFIVVDESSHENASKLREDEENDDGKKIAKLPKRINMSSGARM